MIINECVIDCDVSDDDEETVNRKWMESLMNSRDKSDDEDVCVEENNEKEGSNDEASINRKGMQNLLISKKNDEKINNKDKSNKTSKDAVTQDQFEAWFNDDSTPKSNKNHKPLLNAIEKEVVEVEKEVVANNNSIKKVNENGRHNENDHISENLNTNAVTKVESNPKIKEEETKIETSDNEKKKDPEEEEWTETEETYESDEEDKKEKWLTKKERRKKRKLKRKKQLKKLAKQKQKQLQKEEEERRVENLLVKKEEPLVENKKDANPSDKQYYFGNGLRPIDKKTAVALNIVTGLVDCGFEVIEAKESKENCCTFCKNGHKGDFIQHLNTKHKDEQEVVEMKGFVAFSKDWEDHVKCLEKRARFSSNLSKLEEGEGKLIVEKFPTTEFLNRHSVPAFTLTDVKNFVPCPFCLGFYHEIEIPEHVKQICPLAKKDKNFGKMRNFVKEGRLLLPVKQIKFREDVSKLTNEMANDEIGETVKKDYFILKLGEYMLEKYKDFRSNQHSFIRQRMRVAGRLMNYLQKKKLATCSPSVNSDIGGIKSVLCAEKFNDIKEAAIQMGKDPDNPGNILVTVPLKVGHAVNKIAEVIKMTAMRNPNEREGQKIIDRTEKFAFLMETEWIDTISVKYHRLMDAKKHDKNDSLPLTSDLRNLVEGVKHELEETMHEISEKATKHNLRKLTECLLIRLIVFNMRRVGELSRMRILDFRDAQEGKKRREASEVFDSFTDFEKAMAKKMLLIRMRGKCGRHVACLVPPDAVEALEMIIKHRETAGILSDNQMIFATPGSTTHLQGTNVLKKYAQEFCEKAERITGTKLRKYIASSCQILDLGEDGKDTLSNHLGHQLAVHTTFYRKHADLVEVAKVSQILCLAEAGKLPDNRGKNLSNLDISEQLFEAELMKGTFEQEKDEANEEQESDFEQIDSDGEIAVLKPRSSAVKQESSSTPASKRIKTETKGSLAEKLSVKIEEDEIKVLPSLTKRKRPRSANENSANQSKPTSSDIVTID